MQLHNHNRHYFFFFCFKSHYLKFGELTLADPGQTPACSLPNPTASPRLVVSPSNRCQAVLTCPYLTHSWLPASIDRLLEGKPAAIWNIIQALPSSQRSGRPSPHLATCSRRSNNQKSNAKRRLLWSADRNHLNPVDLYLRVCFSVRCV